MLRRDFAVAGESLTPEGVSYRNGILKGGAR
jgi:hypothetical protein